MFSALHPKVGHRMERVLSLFVMFVDVILPLALPGLLTMRYPRG